MRAGVLTDPRLVELAGRFAWLEIDAEAPAAAPFLERFPVEALPTFLVLDPASERVLLRWIGTAAAPDLARLLRSTLDAGPGRREADAARAALDRGRALAAARRHADAADAFREAIALGGARWPGREAAADALLQSLAVAGAGEACAADAARLLPSLPPGPATVRIAGQGLACAAALDDEGERDAAIATLEPPALRALSAPGALPDDVDGLYAALVDARRARGDGDGARALARRWLAYAEDQAARAPTPLARSVFDGARLHAALALGEPRRALPALLASAAALPAESFPRTALAECWLALGEPARALEAARAAAALDAGPRRVRALLLEARALEAAGDRDGARAAAAAAVRHGEALAPSVRPRAPLDAARALLAELSG